jgi:peptidoglycan hydrolase-like protein with peptidoglycan-binding domain
MRKHKLIIFFLVLTLSLTSVVFADNLKYGSRGQEVVKVQTKLKSLGFFKGNVTDYFGSITKAAVKKFQASKGLAADGIVGPQTAKALFGSGTSSVSTASRAASNSLTREQLKRVQAVLKAQGLYKGQVDGIYGKLTNAAVKQFQQKNGLAVTGSIDAATESKLIASENIKEVASRGGTSAAATEADKKAKIEMLDWWKDGNKVFSIGKTAKVTDVRTGKTFNIMRTYGSRHADCETLTLEDSKIMKEVWGGNWSWTRRPVILEVDGRRLAASMAAMPHAGVDSQPANKILNSRSQGYGRGYNLDKVKNNGMDGVFDVHFLNSKTHGTNRVDSNHQKAVKEAAASEK